MARKKKEKTIEKDTEKVVVPKKESPKEEIIEEAPEQTITAPEQSGWVGGHTL